MGSDGTGRPLRGLLLSRRRRLLLPQPELDDERQIQVPVGLAKVLQEIGALADEFEQPAAAREVLLVCPHVLGQVVDPGREKRDLNLRRAAVALATTKLLNQFGLLLLRDRHLPALRNPRRVALLPFSYETTLVTHTVIRIYALYRRPTRWQGRKNE